MARQVVQSSYPQASRKGRGQMPDMPGDKRPFGSTASFNVSWNRLGIELAEHALRFEDRQAVELCYRSSARHFEERTRAATRDSSTAGCRPASCRAVPRALTQWLLRARPTLAKVWFKSPIREPETGHKRRDEPPRNINEPLR
jgi:hypothetical protein